MASNFVINTVSYTGTPASPATPFKPSSYTMTDTKIGKVVINANGGRTFVARSVQKKTFTIGWELCHETTRAALRTLAELTTVFNFTDQLGTVYVCQVENDDYEEEWVKSDAANNPLYNCKITLRQA